MRIIMALLLGAWMAGTAVVAWMAAQNFFMIDRLLDTPANAAFAAAVDKLPNGEARMTLRYLSSELNRYYFSAWGWIGMGTGFALLGMAAQITGKQLKIGLSLMVAISALMVLYLTPQIVDVGREMDFVLPSAENPQRVLFGRLHGIYSSLELLKLTLGVWMAVALVRSGRKQHS